MEQYPVPLLEVRDLAKRYPDGPKALDGVNLRIDPGERVILLGRNGAGKTTLIRCILGLVQPDRGQIWLGGVPVHPARWRAQGVGVMFEDAGNSYAYLTALENVLYFGLLNGWPPAEAGRRALQALTALGLDQQAGHLTQSLSRGQRQKLALAVALTRGAPLLLLDEPTLGLDIEAQHNLRRFIRDEMDPALGLLIATHDASFACAVGTRYLILEGGRILIEATPDEVGGPEALEALYLAVVRKTATGTEHPHAIRQAAGRLTSKGASRAESSRSLTLPPGAQPRFGNALRAAWIKKRAEYRRYWLDFLVGLSIKCIFFLGALFAVPGAPPAELALRVLGFGLWYLSAHVVAKMGNMALEEAYLGTAQQVLVTRTHPARWLAATVGVELALSCTWVAMFTVIAAVLTGPRALLSGWGTVGWPALPLALAGLGGMIGCGLVALGLSLRYKQVGSLVEVFLYYLLVFSGFFLPPGAIPVPLKVLNAVSPLARVVDGLRSTWQGGPLGPVLLAAWGVAFLWLGVGWLVARRQWAWARRTGRLGSIA
ncbi:ABC transporter ATP-binding protein/permease [Thermaerobacter subterraneus]|uniref:ABC-type multidrug transport system, ATPase component n=1 Tax=Thermaerobacter subterraneus DSM 13965 TaxID=867903 RepID=K6P0H1_9FIRM|nr:ATP-binding cassette domain-containing protein [Thermaerobacter subterraneus]EKP94590.1 ABC-type multidrug transport system, ATPase component [Thermaerobacter subterraneus DSM 13965]